MSARVVVLRLTEAEAMALSAVAGNGWGDGDFAEWLQHPATVAACERAMEKLNAAAYRHKRRGTKVDRPALA